MVNLKFGSKLELKSKSILKTKLIKNITSYL